MLRKAGVLIFWMPGRFTAQGHLQRKVLQQRLTPSLCSAHYVVCPCIRLCLPRKTGTFPDLYEGATRAHRGPKEKDLKLQKPLFYST